MMNRYDFKIMLAITMATWCTGMISSNQAGPMSVVDQAVADQDALGVSLRRLESGLGTTGQQAGLYQLSPMQLPAPIITPGTGSAHNLGQPLLQDPVTSLLNPLPRYLRVDSGVRAVLDRIDYVVRSSEGRGYRLNQAPVIDGDFIEYPGPNTVFQLQPVLPGAPYGTMPTTLHPDQRIDGRIDGRINGRVGP